MFLEHKLQRQPCFGSRTNTVRQAGVRNDKMGAHAEACKLTYFLIKLHSRWFQPPYFLCNVNLVLRRMLLHEAGWHPGDTNRQRGQDHPQYTAQEVN